MRQKCDIRDEIQAKKLLEVGLLSNIVVHMVSV